MQRQMEASPKPQPLIRQIKTVELQRQVQELQGEADPDARAGLSNLCAQIFERAQPFELFHSCADPFELTPELTTPKKIEKLQLQTEASPES